ARIRLAPDQLPQGGAGRCLLKHALDAAERSFVRELDRFTLADVLAGPTGAALRELIGRETNPGAQEPSGSAS
ncbi:hypothetical protein ACQKLZ_33140, partial [Methylobacterium tarhaniae]